MNKIILENANKYYFNKEKNIGIAALLNVSLKIKEGSFNILSGPSGCGKTTLLRVISGLEFLDEGVLLINNIDFSNIPANKRRIAYVSQSFTLYPHLTIFDNIAFPLKHDSVLSDEIRLRINEVATILNINHLLTRKPKVLSGGQQQIVAIAKAIIKKPDLILFDEPFSNLDIINTEKLKKIIYNIYVQLSPTIILSTHHTNQFENDFYNHIYMENGQIDTTE